jgi:hypothetical protein
MKERIQGACFLTDNHLKSFISNDLLENSEINQTIGQATRIEEGI